MFAFVVFVFVCSVLSQEIGWEERLRNDLCLCWVGRKTLTQSIEKYFSISLIWMFMLPSARHAGSNTSL